MRRHEQLEKLASDYAAYRAMEVEARESREKVGNSIKKLMTELQLTEYFADDSTLRYKSQVQHSFNSKELKVLHPALFEQFLIEREIMVLRVS